MIDIEKLFALEATLRAAARTLERCEAMKECDDNRDRVIASREGARKALRAAAIAYGTAVRTCYEGGA